ncbi:MAG TPA: hypothetical protein VFE27_22530 [Acidobacteriaceae bacterium]|nr:hypothetical protein [Acidobacteriaceae bacterium]
MKKLLAVLTVLLCCANVQAQNIEGQIIASQYGKWRVPGYAPNTYSSFAPSSCRVQGGASFFFAFTVGTPIAIVDANPALTETVMPTSTVDTNVSCAVTIAPSNDHEVPFYLTSATGGLQEALNQNFTTPQTNTVILDSTFYELVGGAANAAAVIAAAQGSIKLGLMDVTQVPTAWYQWNGTQYVKVSIIGSAGNLNTRQADIVTNNGTNNAAVDEDAYIANSPTAGASVYTPQQAINAAAAHNGSIILQPGAKRAPFTNPGNYRAQDNRPDVPATARSVTEDGAVCDAREVYGTLASGSNVLTLTSGTLTSDDIGRSAVAAITTASPPTQFESVIVSITDSAHAVLTTASPAAMATAHEITIGHDDTPNITHTMNVVGGGTLVFPAGECMTHTQSLRGQSPIGLGFNSQIVGMPGEDIFQAPDPSLGPGVNQGSAHIHDLTFLPDGRIDATQTWQKCNDSGCTTVQPMYRPVATLSGVAADPLAPGWMVGARNGVAAIADGSAVMCVPNAETPPSVGQTVIFPYLASIYTSTVASTAGTCASGFTARTLNANLPTGSANAQAEWFAGSSVQNLASPISSGSCPTSISLSNNINPVPGWESNVPPFGLIQIDGEQFAYFGRSNAGNTSPANTLYGIQCAQNGTTRAAHSSAATVFPLNRFKPSYPWPVIPSINSGDTTPSGNASYYPGWNVGNSAFAFPVATGANPIGSGGWSANAKIENLSFYAWPNEINGVNDAEVNNTAMLYFVTPHYASTFANLYTLYLFYGIANGAPSVENHGYATSQPTGDGTHWDGLQIYAANPVILSAGNQNSFSNFNVYSQETSPTGSGLGADTCFYFTHLTDDQNGGYFDVLSLDHFKNLYCEPEAGPHAGSMPQWEWDTYNSEIEDQHMGGGGEVYIGGAQQHWFGGNFNNSPGAPVIVWGSQNSSMRSTNLGSEPKGNVYGTNSLINFSWGSDFTGTTAQAFGSSTGPWGSGQVGGRETIPSQTNETFNTGNLTAPYTSSEGGFITPEEFNAQFNFESQAMSVGYTFDDTSPLTHSYAACNVGNNPGVFYCYTSRFNQELIGVGPGQRITNGKYTMYLSAKDATAATNAWTFSVGTTCGGTIGTYTVPLTNAWPTTAKGVFTTPIDFTGITAAGCGLRLILQGATTADQIQIGYLDFAPVAEQLNAQTINATTINLPGGSTGSTPTGCAQSPVTGINAGYTCPTKGDQTTLTANQGVSDTTIQVSATSQFSSAGCFFVDGEYECYTSIVDGTHFGGITRGAYLTTPTTHNSAAPLIGVSLVLGSPQQPPSTVIAYGSTEAQLFSVNNGFPFNHGGASVMSINNGSNETWFDTTGAIHQINTGAANLMQGALVVGASPLQPAISESGYLLQTNGANSAYQPMTLGGGHAGSLNVIATSNIAAPTLTNFAGSGSTTYSYVCSGTDFDGNLIPGTTATITNAPASWAFPQAIQVVCPWNTAGVNTYQIYRTAGGPSQGLLTSGTGPGFGVFDFYGAASGGTPPASNGSNPHISVTGSGNPTVTMGTVEILNGAGAPTGCGTTYGNGSIYSNTSGAHGTTSLLYVCDAATTTWVAIE